MSPRFRVRVEDPQSTIDAAIDAFAQAPTASGARVQRDEVPHVVEAADGSLVLVEPSLP